MSEILFAKYTAQLPPPVNPQRQAALTQGQTVVITGTTGRLGSYILQILESLDSVSKIICLNRQPDGGRIKQVIVCIENGIQLSLNKVDFYCMDATKPRLGLSDLEYHHLLETADHVIHNAWPVNFAMSVAQFEPNIQALRCLVDFTAAATKDASLTFISSAATIARRIEKSPVPESPISDLRVAATGYGQSKLVADQMLQKASEICGIRVTSLRVGQIAGPLRENGLWNPQEWVPALIASSVTIGALPSSLGPLNQVNWVPIDHVAKAVLELSQVIDPLEKYHGGDTDRMRVFNLLNPKEAEWKQLAMAAQEYYLQQGCKMKLISLSDWADRIKRCPESAVLNPAIMLLDPIKQIVSLAHLRYKHPGCSQTKAIAASPTCANMGPITRDMMMIWCKQWKFEHR